MQGVALRDEPRIVTPTFAITAFRGQQHTRSGNMARPKLTVYLDVVSPFGYMAFYMTRVSAFKRLISLHSFDDMLASHLGEVGLS